MSSLTKARLQSDIQPGNATDKTVVWSSSDEGVATVSDGVVTCISKGLVTITAKAGNVSDSIQFYFYTEIPEEGYIFLDEENTYYIWNEEGLLAWDEYVTNENNYVKSTDGYTYVVETNATLMDDIMLPALEEGQASNWTPVGYYDDSTRKEYSYAGTFDGGGHIISNLKIDSSDSNYLGLFMIIAPDGVVKDLTLSDVEISGNNYIGGIAGNNYGTIENCSVSGSVSTVEGGYAGGIAGYNSWTIENCNISRSVSGTNIVGGIVGYNGGTIKACYNTGEVSGTEYVGGIVGWNQKGTITDCYNTRSVSGTSFVGGIAGYSNGIIENCNVSGSVSGNNSIGGIAGYNAEDGKITTCYNTGSVSERGTQVGGIVGNNNMGTITACYNTGNVSGSGNDVGGIVGYNNGEKITACYWSVSEESSITGIGNNPESALIIKVGSDGVTWADAKSGMNKALGTESEYSYEENNDPITKETMPLIIEKSSN